MSDQRTNKVSKKTYLISEVDTHIKAVTYISNKMGIPCNEVDYIIKSFFGRNGIKYYIGKMIPVKIHGFGKIYWHKSTIKKQKRIDKLAEEYDSRQKQRFYMSRKRGRISKETALLHEKVKKTRKIL